MADPILDLIKKGPKPLKSICYDKSAYDFLNSELLPVLQNYREEAREYCRHRDLEAGKLASAKNNAEAELKFLFENYPDVEVILMSSVGANLHLSGTSDIDFGVVVKDLTTDKIETYGTILTRAGYVPDRETNGYFPYQKKIFNIDIEAKLRDLDNSVKIIELHNCLDQLPSETQQLLTYAKSIAYTDKATYDNFKKIIYSAYFTEINNFI